MFTLREGGGRRGEAAISAWNYREIIPRRGEPAKNSGLVPRAAPRRRSKIALAFALAEPAS